MLYIKLRKIHEKVTLSALVVSGLVSSFVFADDILAGNKEVVINVQNNTGTIFKLHRKNVSPWNAKCKVHLKGKENIFIEDDYSLKPNRKVELVAHKEMSNDAKFQCEFDLKGINSKGYEVLYQFMIISKHAQNKYHLSYDFAIDSGYPYIATPISGKSGSNVTLSNEDSQG